MLAYDVSQRTREIGIRGAIGATRDQIVALILRQGLWKAIKGLLVGVGGALVLSRYWPLCSSTWNRPTRSPMWR